MACVALIAFSMPVGVGQRVLAGLGRNHISIAVLGLQTPLVLAALLLLLWWHVPAGPSVAVLAYGATFVLSVACCVIAARLIRPAGVEAVRLLPRLRGFRGVRVADTAWPMLVQSIALPIAMQTDRLVLSHRTGAAVLAQYNLASQMFTPIWAVVSSAGVTLWPVFARARARGLPASPLPMSGIFGGSAAVMAGAIALASPWLAELASGGRIRLPGALIAAFVVLMILQAVKYPLGTFLTDVAGLRFQALMIVLTLPLNLGLSWYLAGPLGAAGPVIGSIVGVAGAQVLANLLYVRRRLRSSGGAAA
jgi:O-antigen/teichoic acid export membrane protein